MLIKQGFAEIVYIDCSFKDAETLMFVRNGQGNLFWAGGFSHISFTVFPPLLLKNKNKNHTVMYQMLNERPWHA